MKLGTLKVRVLLGPNDLVFYIVCCSLKERFTLHQTQKEYKSEKKMEREREREKGLKGEMNIVHLQCFKKTYVENSSTKYVLL